MCQATRSAAVWRVNCVNDMLSYKILRGRWCKIVFNVHAPNECKRHDSKNGVYEALKRILNYRTTTSTFFRPLQFKAKVWKHFQSSNQEWDFIL